VAIKLNELADRFGGVVAGDPHCQISAIASLADAGEGDISFLANSRYRHYLATTSAAVVIVKASDRDACKSTAWVVDDPYSTYARVAQLLYPPPQFEGGVHASACVDDTAVIAVDAWIGPQCVIGSGVHIAKQAYIGPGCIIEAGSQVGAYSRFTARVVLCRDVQVGQRVILHPGVVLGADGFGFANDKGQWLKIPQIGRVILGDDVEIGANTTVDRGALDDTVLEDGVKLDNQIQVGHNVRIGAHTAIAAGTGIAGSTVIGQRCAIGGHVGINGHLIIADDVQITGKSFVTGSIKESGVYSSGYPLESNRQWRRNAVRLHQLDDMARRLRRLEKPAEDE
jgi:UDP-3-O-[3-hydroxymyristoyl] glucosamine N-acyltransferase